MLTTETPTQQADHFEWLNALEFYSSYLDIIKGRLDALNGIHDSIEIEKKKLYFEELLAILKNNLADLESVVTQHLVEMDTQPVFDNMLEKIAQSGHHHFLRQKFDELEDDINDFRGDFNQFYVNSI